MYLRKTLLFTTLGITTAACSLMPTKPAEPFDDYIWLTLGPNNQKIARVVIPASKPCPTIELDGISQPMSKRGKDGGPEGFNEVITCETTVAPSVKSASINGTKLALLQQAPQRIIVIGDTGCRMKGSSFQNCNGAKDAGPAWPFAKMAKIVADAKPDLIVHVGDYHYREAPCPVGDKGCKGSPWGFNWPVWQQDFFKPAAPLLAKAPWVFTRGNHEDCKRAWKGWFYFLATDKASTNPWQECQPYTPAYGVELGDLTLVSMDSASLPGAYSANIDQSTVAQYAKIYNEVNELTQNSHNSWVMTHRPIWAISSFNNNGTPDISMSDPTMQAGLKASQKGAFADSVNVLLNGHIHNFEALTFADGRPSSMVIGDSGTQLSEQITDQQLLDKPQILADLGIQREDFYSAGGFAYVLFERLPTQSLQRWRVSMVDINGQIRKRYTLAGKRLQPMD